LLIDIAGEGGRAALPPEDGILDIGDGERSGANSKWKIENGKLRLEAKKRGRQLCCWLK